MKLVVVPGKGDWNEQTGVGRMGGGYVSRYSSPRSVRDRAFPWSPGHVERKWPGLPQYRQRRSLIRRSLSAWEMRPICMGSGGASEDKGGDSELGLIGARGLRLSSLSLRRWSMREANLIRDSRLSGGQFILDSVGKAFQKAHRERLVVPATRCCHRAELDGIVRHAAPTLVESQELFG